MRPRILISVLIVFSVALILIWLLRPKQPANSILLPQFSNTPGGSQQANQSVKAATPQQRPQPLAAHPIFPVRGTASPSEIIELSNQVQSGWVDKIVRPIEFYGKVVDENTNPVSGANVSFIYNRFSYPEASFTTNTVSDSSGLFSLSGVKGSTLGVQVQKDGYYSVKGDSQRSTIIYHALPLNRINPILQIRSD